MYACQTQKAMIFVDLPRNRDNAMIACEIYKTKLNGICMGSPEQMANQLGRRFTSAVLQSPACKESLSTRHT
jgi:hypothetical protein